MSTLRYDDVSAVIVTRGDVDLSEIKATLPYGEVIVWDNSQNPKDLKVYGRYHAAEMMASRPVIYFQDDDIVFRNHEALVAAYEPGKLVANMDQAWVESCGYEDLALVGLGSLCDKGLWKKQFYRYLADHPRDDVFYKWCDFIFGALAPYHREEFGAEILPVASAPNRMWTTDGNFLEKWQAIHRARSLRKVVLAIMCKNEEEYIGDAIRSAEGLYDSAVILDTGSTDGTIAAAQAALSGPQWFVEEPFVDFATSRTRLLELARERGDYILMMDADETLIDRPEKWPELTKDLYYFVYDDEVEVAQPRLIKAWRDWSFRGRVHGYLSYDGKYEWDIGLPAEHTRYPRIKHHGETRHLQEKLESDVKALREMLEEEPGSGRVVFHLAKALEGLGDLEEARDLHIKRARMDDPTGEDEEGWYSHFKAGVLTAALGEYAQATDMLQAAYVRRPWRNEPLRALETLVKAKADEIPYPQGEMLFVHRDCYLDVPAAGPPPRKPTVVLTMMAKNEAHQIERALKSALGLYDSVLLLDTGSTDGTQDVVFDFCEAQGLYLLVSRAEFTNFGEMRNRMLERGREMGDYMLLMDADEELIGHTGEWPVELGEDGYILHYAGELDVAQPRLLKSTYPWHFGGIVHAALEAPEDAPRPTGVNLKAPLIVHHGDFTQGLGEWQQRMGRDIALCTQEIEAGNDVPRHTFLRAKAYEGAEEWDKAIADYTARCAMSTGDEEAYYSKFRLGILTAERLNDFAGAADLLIEARRDRPQRNEALRALAFYATALADATPYPDEDFVLVHRDLYRTTTTP